MACFRGGVMAHIDKYSVTGMSCAACQAHVEKAVRGVKGVEDCSVSLLTNSMSVTGDAKPEEIISAVERAGYGAGRLGSRSREKSAQSGTGDDFSGQTDSADRQNAGSAAEIEEALKDKTTPLLIRRLVLSAVLLALLIYLADGVMMAGLPAPSVISGSNTGNGIVQMFIAGLILVINQKFFISGIKSLLGKAPNMDTLVAMGSGVSYLYSVIVLVNMSRSSAVSSSMNGLYFESSAMIVTLITVGKLLESISKGKTTDALKSLVRLMPTKCTVVRDGVCKEADISELAVGDVFIVKPGESVATDGIIIEGESSIDESALTGESMPVDKNRADMVYAATVNKTGVLRCRAVRVGEDTTLSHIIELVDDASRTKAPIARIADKVAGVFVPSVIAVAVVVFVVWLLAGGGIATALTRAIAVLVVSCPCALGLATPVAVMVANGSAARKGILFKTGEAIEAAGRIRTVALDKTGTITAGRPQVTDVVCAEGVDEDYLLSMAYSIEKDAGHPLSLAVNDYCESREVKLVHAGRVQSESGSGLNAVVGETEVFGGRDTYVGRFAVIPDDLKLRARKMAESGRSVMFFATHDRVLGFICVADRIREDSVAAIREIKDMGIKVVMLTGDNEAAAGFIARQAGVDSFIASVMPDGKAAEVRKLSQDGSVAMVGDGINDAPALAAANLGIAIGAGTDVAIDAAQVVLMHSSLKDLSAAIRLSSKTLTVIRENLFWAFIYNILLIPLAAGAYYRFGLTMSPVFGAAAMSLSSFTVCMNALRINSFRLNKRRYYND